MSSWWRVRGAGWLANAAEISVIQKLIDCRGALLLDQGAIDVKSDAGNDACKTFLSLIDETAKVLGIGIAPRDYRDKFSPNYRALFLDYSRHYRVDVLDASVDQQLAIWVNGEKFELSSEALRYAQGLQGAYWSIVMLLDMWTDTLRDLDLGHKVVKPSREELTDALTRFDVAWAEFEKRYIGELIAIEEKARVLITKAVELERKLPIPSNLAQSDEALACTLELERGFVQCIAQLNSVANFKRKGRDDLGIEILTAARAELRNKPDKTISNRARSAGAILAGDVISSYQAMRNYFRVVGTRIEHVDPHLCNNAGLVARLVDWEESWEVAAKYVKNTPLFDAICDIVEEIKKSTLIAPKLTNMISDCDVEMFLVLPRIVVLCFLADPLNRRTELMRSLLPHRFGPVGRGGVAGSSFMKVDHELKALYDRFKETAQIITGSDISPSSSPTPAVRHRAWEQIVQHAVNGEEASEPCPPAIADLLRTVERWSVELQRYCPQDWNQCSAVLVHCLNGGSKKDPATVFQV